VASDKDISPSAIHAYLSNLAKAGWQRMAEDNGVSTTGLMEAMGLNWAEAIRANGGEADGLNTALVKQARKIDALRRWRGR
jgi:hypothetical protein